MLKWAVLMLLLLPTVSGAELYQWTDANGVRHFSNTPPPAEADDLRQMEEVVGSDDTATDRLRQTLDLFESDADRSDATARIARRQRHPKVVMYTTPTCGYCHRAKAYFNEHGIAYTEVDVTTSSQGRRDFKRLNGRGVPLILIGDQRISGFNPSAIDQALGLP